MRKKINFTAPILGILLLTLLITACGNGTSPDASPLLVVATSAPMALALQPTAAAIQQNQPTSAAANAPDVSQQRVVLKNATLSLTVDDPAKSVMLITQMAEQMGGWVVNSNSTIAEREGHKVIQATISVRVPAVQFSSALEQIKVGSASIDSETITGDDVTQKYVDLSSQLSNLEATEAQYQKIMSTTTNINDVLTVQQKLTDVQGQIAGIKGQLKYFSEASAYSLINLTLTQTPPPQTPGPTPMITPTPTPKPLGLSNWQPDQIAQSAANTVVAGAQIIISVLIWLLIVGIPVAIPALIVFYIYRRFQRRTQPKRSESSAD